MILWTIQHKSAYETMNKTGYLRTDGSHTIDESFYKAYQWMMEQMQLRIGPPSVQGLFPIWAWYQWEGKRKRPDMRTHGRGWGEKGTPIILLTVDIPDEFVLLSDFDYWHVVLNDVALVEENDMRATWSKEEKRESWEKIFDIECALDPQSELCLSTQATMWEIKSEWVLAAEEFISR